MRARSMSLSKLWHSYVVHLRNEVFLLQRMEDQNLKNQALNQYNILSEGLRALLCVCVHAKRGIENATAIILRLLRVKIGPVLGLLYCTAVLSPMSFVITNYPN